VAPIYSLVIDACRQAEPKDLLQKRYQQFQRRLARHYINMSTTEQEGGATEEEGGPSQLENKTRVALQRVGGVSGQGENQQQGLTRRPSGHSSSSRTKPSGSSSSGAGACGSSGNFVVFQEDASEVKRRNGDVALSGAAGAAWESFAPEKVKTKENDGKKKTPLIT
jgi:hypothetical protein